MNYITERKIEESTKNMFTDCGKEIIGKHNPLNGEKDFVLCMIEQCIGLLNRDEINDEKSIIYTQSMLLVSNQELKEYTIYLNSIYNDKTIQ